MEISKEQFVKMARAIMLAQRLNNDSRAGVPLTDDDWGEVYRECEDALNGVPREIEQEARKVFDQEKFAPPARPWIGYSYEQD